MTVPVIAQFGQADRRQIAEEIKANPPFGAWIKAMLRDPDGERLVALSAQKAVANEFNPRLYPETKGQWVTLRRRAVELARSLPDVIDRELERVPFAEKMRIVRAIAAGRRPSVEVSVAGLGDLGQFEIIGTIVSSIAGAASTVYTNRVTTSAQKDIAKIQATTAMKDLQAQISIADAQKAIANAQAAQGGGVLTKDIGGGIPLWVLPVALGAIGVILYFVFKR